MYFVNVEVLRGRLCLLTTYATVRPCDVRVMKQYGVKDSRTKLSSFQGRDQIKEGSYMKPFVHSKSGDKVLVPKTTRHQGSSLV